jgi:GalNAc5-diNAcBac-PP-undecaprenol beta-1,3-glucosyltransferase
VKFTILIPTHDHGAVIATAINSVREQTHKDWELYIVADGAPAAALAAVDSAVGDDPRIRVFRFAKGERHGEAWRHEVLQQATGEAVCYLGDDDFWFPDHLEHMQPMLESADFAHTRQTIIWPSYEVNGPLNDIADEATRERMLHTRFNYFGPSVSGHRLDAYKRLPIGWSPAPTDLWTDLHMWRKWIAAEGVRFRSSYSVTTAHLPRSLRPGQDDHDALLENAFWREVFRDPDMRQALKEIMSGGDTKFPFALVVERARALRIGEEVAAAAELQEMKSARKIIETELREAQTAWQESDLALGEARREREIANAELNAMRNTATWRYTRPLRELWARLRRAH